MFSKSLTIRACFFSILATATAHANSTITVDKNGVEHITTHNQYKLGPWFQKNSPCFLSPDGQKVYLTNKNFVKENNKSDKEGFLLLAPGDTFEQPDRHGRAHFHVTAIKGNKIIIAYQSMFNHSSFGYNKVTTDIGEFSYECDSLPKNDQSLKQN